MDRISDLRGLRGVGAETGRPPAKAAASAISDAGSGGLDLSPIADVTELGSVFARTAVEEKVPFSRPAPEFVLGSPGPASSDFGVERANAGAATAASGIPTDTFFHGQYHLRNTTAGERDLNIFRGETSAWDDYTGQGVNVGVIDDGIDKSHVDLNDNYNAALETVDGSHLTAADRHGTAVSGIIAAERNGEGMVGVAYDCSITMMGAIGTSPSMSIIDALENAKNFDVVNNSWEFLAAKFTDSIYNPWYSGVYASMQEIIQLGRDGLGTVFVKAAANGRDDANRDNANFSNLNSHWGSVTVAGVERDGYVSSYSSEGACVLVSAFGGPLQGDVWTTDRTGDLGYTDSGDSPYPDYTGGFNGTSAAAPMVTGVVALMLEANADLGYRDVQDILALTACHTGSAIGAGLAGAERYAWEFNHASNWNGGGMHFSEDYGFGLVDALAAVRLAESWTETKTRGNLTSISQSSFTASGSTISDNASLTVQFVVGSGVVVEHALLSLGMTHTWVGDLTINLTSPTGTVSELLKRNGGNSDVPDYGVGDIMLSSSMFRGEDSAGTWTLTIADDALGDTGTLSAVGLQLLGSPSSNADDVHVLTEEYSDYATAGRMALADTNGGLDTLNATAVFSASVIKLDGVGSSTVDGVSFTTDGNFENAYSGDGADRLSGNALANLLSGGRGDDSLAGGGGADILDGGRGDDVYDADGFDTVLDEAGIDLVRTEAGAYALVAALEHLVGYALTGQSLTGNSGANAITGASGDDTLIGGNGADTLVGGVGNDSLVGGAGVDTVSYASAGHAAVTVDLANATATGGHGADALGTIENVIGTAGGDSLKGNVSNNILSGGKGNDTLEGSGGDDTLNGGSNIDTVSFASFAKGVTADLGRADKQDTGAGLDMLISIENLIGSTRGDLLAGSSGDNQIEGGAGADTLSGGGGRDKLDGGVGVDRLTGGAGKDILTGGGQADVFIYVSVGDSKGKARDVIVDLAASDQIDLSAIDAKSLDGDQGFDLVDDLTGAEGQMTLVYSVTRDQTTLLLDIDGNGKADMAIVIDGDHTDFMNFVF